MDSVAGFRNGQNIWQMSLKRKDSTKFASYTSDTARAFFIYPKFAKGIIDSIAFHKDEKDSEYPGGIDRWNAYLNSSLRYPERALKLRIQGRVEVGFEIDREGNLKDIQIAHSVEYSLDEEAIRIVRESGKWRPAYQNGGNVLSGKKQPIVFKLTD